MTGNTITFKIDPKPTWTRKARSKPAANAEPEDVAEQPAPAPKSPTVPRLARMLALAHHLEALIESGKLRDYAHAARLLGVTRARMTQVMNLLFLPVPLQEDVLLGRVRTTERALRAALKEPVWPQARETA